MIISKIIKKYFIISVITSILLSCSTTNVQRSLSNQIPFDFFGLVHAGSTGSPEEYQLLDEIGAVWLLQTFYWENIEKEQGVFDFSWYDNFVNSAKENNKKVIAVMAYGTPWTGDKHRYISKENIHHFLNFLEVTVNRYKGKVDAWQIWNEPNFVFWKGSNNDFFELSKQSAQRIRETDSDAFIIGGGILRAPRNFIKGMYNSGAFENIDAVSFHPYSLNPYWAMKIYDDFLKIMDEINYKGEIWITEIGFPTGGWYPTRVSMEKFPSYVIKTIVESIARGARTLMWYQFADNYSEGDYPDKMNSEDYFGLTYSNRTKKSGGFAYELCARYLPGSQLNNDFHVRENVPSNVVSFCFINGKMNKNVLIIWNNKNRLQDVKITSGSPFVLYDIVTGISNIMPSETFLKITNMPLFITWEGSYIYITN